MTDRDFAYHVQDIDYANPLAVDEVLLRVRVRRADVASVDLHVAGSSGAIAMRRTVSLGRHDFYEALVAVPPQGISYCFVLDGHTWFTKYGIYEERAAAFGWWSFICTEADVFKTPEWVRDAVFYQIFPERFCNGDRRLDPPDVRPWDATPGIWDFFGGDLVGVLDRLPYLQSLGINALYFNPIFAASTNHKYNTTDYYKIDPQFGDLPLFKKLVAACHERGIKVMLDGVFNHVGVDFFAFQDVLEKGADSPYVDWFFIKQFPLRTEPVATYICWWDIWELPKLNLQNPAVRQYLLDVGTYWVRECGIDGWRLDVPEEVPHSFWIEFRRAIKAIRPDAYIVGEIWHDGRPWLRGDKFDAVMNYRFREAALNLVGARTRDSDPRVTVAGDVSVYDHRIQDLLSDLPLQAIQAQFNLLGSHDTERVRTLVGGDGRKVRLLAALMFTSPGAPTVYYGDEVGMEGGHDPDCRRGFPWDAAHQDADMLQAFRALIALRHAHPALRRGAVRTLAAEREAAVYAFARDNADESVIVVVNPSAESRTVSVPLTPHQHTGKPRSVYGPNTVTLDGHEIGGALGPWEVAIFQTTP